MKGIIAHVFNLCPRDAGSCGRRWNVSIVSRLECCVVQMRGIVDVKTFGLNTYALRLWRLASSNSFSADSTTSPGRRSVALGSQVRCSRTWRRIKGLSRE